MEGNNEQTPGTVLVRAGALGLLAVYGILAIGAALLSILNGGFTLITLSPLIFAAYPVMGALILVRQGNHAVGWILAVDHGSLTHGWPLWDKSHAGNIEIEADVANPHTHPQIIVRRPTRFVARREPATRALTLSARATDGSTGPDGVWLRANIGRQV